MRRSLTTLGLAAMAMLAFAAASAASASANEQPEYNLKTPQPFTAESGPGVLETAGGREVECESSTATGALVSFTEVEAAVEFHGCTATGPFGIKLTCKSPGAESGQIVTNPLISHLYYIDYLGEWVEVEPGVKEQEVEEKTGLELHPAVGAQFAAFNCGGLEEIIVDGSVVGVITPENKLTNTFELSFTQHYNEKEEQELGVQDPLGYLKYNSETKECEEVEDHLETEGKGFEPFQKEQSAIKDLEKPAVITLTEEHEGEIVQEHCG